MAIGSAASRVLLLVVIFVAATAANAFAWINALSIIEKAFVSYETLDDLVVFKYGNADTSESVFSVSASDDDFSVALDELCSISIDGICEKELNDEADESLCASYAPNPSAEAESLSGTVDLDKVTVSAEEHFQAVADNVGGAVALGRRTRYFVNVYGMSGDYQGVKLVY